MHKLLPMPLLHPYTSNLVAIKFYTVKQLQLYATNKLIQQQLEV